MNKMTFLFSLPISFNIPPVFGSSCLEKSGFLGHLIYLSLFLWHTPPKLDVSFFYLLFRFSFSFSPLPYFVICRLGLDLFYSGSFHQHYGTFSRLASFQHCLSYIPLKYHFHFTTDQLKNYRGSQVLMHWGQTLSVTFLKSSPQSYPTLPTSSLCTQLHKTHLLLGRWPHFHPMMPCSLLSLWLWFSFYNVTFCLFLPLRLLNPIFIIQDPCQVSPPPHHPYTSTKIPVLIFVNLQFCYTYFITM